MTFSSSPLQEGLRGQVRRHAAARRVRRRSRRRRAGRRSSRGADRVHRDPREIGPNKIRYQGRSRTHGLGLKEAKDLGRRSEAGQGRREQGRAAKIKAPRRAGAKSRSNSPVSWYSGRREPPHSPIRRFGFAPGVLLTCPFDNREKRGILLLLSAALPFLLRQGAFMLSVAESSRAAVRTPRRRYARIPEVLEIPT